MMNRLVIATKNPGKIKEFKELLQGLDVKVETLEDFPGIHIPTESGFTFADNARFKAGFVSSMIDMPALGDDSGLEVDFLEGRPGIHSARFAGEPADDKKNNEKLLELMKDVPWEKRTARFRCVVCLITLEGDTYFGEGILEGYITEEPRGDQGFGYDPLFYIEEYGKTLAELGGEIKNKISHRARAVQDLWPVLAGIFR